MIDITIISFSLFFSFAVRPLPIITKGVGMSLKFTSKGKITCAILVVSLQKLLRNVS